MDTYEYKAQQRRMEKESATRANLATKGARTSSGGTGFQGSTAYDNPLDTGSPKRPAPKVGVEPYKPSAPITAAESGGAVDEGGPSQVYGLDYMGHFANDDVIRKGHNTGAPSSWKKGY